MKQRLFPAEHYFHVGEINSKLKTYQIFLEFRSLGKASLNRSAHYTREINVID